MKIVILSDLNWSRPSYTITKDDISTLQNQQIIPNNKKFQTVYAYYRVVINEKPDLVLFAGDLTGDGSCGHGFQFAFSYLLHILELSGIPSFLISGNHDLPQNYNVLLTEISELKLTNEISSKRVEWKGISILGLSFEDTKNKKRYKRLLETYTAYTDIVLAHCALKRRTSLFDFDCQVICTGHYDNKLFQLEGKQFISLSNDFEFINYAVVHKAQDLIHSEYCFYHPFLQQSIRYIPAANESNPPYIWVNDSIRHDLRIYERKNMENFLSDYKIGTLKKIPNWELIDYPIFSFLRGVEYKLALSIMRNFKKDPESIEDRSVFLTLLDLKITTGHSVSKSMLNDYLDDSWKS